MTDSIDNNDEILNDPEGGNARGRRIGTAIARIGWDKSVRVTGKSRKQLSRYIAGHEPPWSVMVALSNATGMPLDWMARGGGEPARAHVWPPPTVDAELLGRVTDVISKTYKSVGAIIQPVELGRLSAKKYQEIVDASFDPDEWESMLKLLATQIKRELTAAAAEPGTGKRLA